MTTEKSTAFPQLPPSIPTWLFTLVVGGLGGLGLVGGTVGTGALGASDAASISTEVREHAALPGHAISLERIAESQKTIAELKSDIAALKLDSAQQSRNTMAICAKVGADCQ